MLNRYRDKLYATLIMKDGSNRQVALEAHMKGDILWTQCPSLPDWSGVAAVEYAPLMGAASAGDRGGYVLPHGHGDTALGDSILCTFRPREDCRVVTGGPEMTMFGVLREEGSYMAVISGMTYEYELVTSVQAGQYRCYPRVPLDGAAPYEPIRVEYVPLPEGADYNDVARAYRRWQIEHDNIVPLKDRAASQPPLAYSTEAVYVRIRQGWKPVPTPVGEQTPDNEPPMHVASTFEDVGRLMDEFHAAGIRKAEFCLVGWNVKGHDGRWPQIFPVEEALGGEEGLRALIAKAVSLGYAISCHTNSTDAYSIADCWDPEDIMRRRDGSLDQNPTSWSGGNMYNLCPHAGLRQARAFLPRVKALGFNGTHYIDVISTVPPRRCYHPAHPVNGRQWVEGMREILRLSRTIFGAVSSEGGYDYCMPELDFGLYVSFGMKNPCPLADQRIPLWQLVYHGFVLSNPYTTTVNPNGRDLLTLLEYGGRPAFYYDSRFVTPDGQRGNWMGEDDYHLACDKDRRESAAYIAQVAALYDRIAYLQRETMERHERLPDGSARVTYSDGTVMVVDYRQGTATLNGELLLQLPVTSK
ncbi:MAG: DUF5696 domain-containing protein [Aristaeellaceae bacterium]